MNNDELKKKIVEIIINAIWKDAEADYDSTDETEACSIADALIAAGIGDVSELKKHRVVVEKSLIPEDDNTYVLPNTPIRVKQLYSGEEVENIVKERNELKVELRDKVDYIHEQDEVIKDYKHRAKVAERALQYAVSVYRCDECPCLDCNAEIRGSQECIDLIIKTYKESAEVELKKEKDND